MSFSSKKAKTILNSRKKRRLVEVFSKGQFCKNTVCSNKVCRIFVFASTNAVAVKKIDMSVSLFRKAIFYINLLKVFTNSKIYDIIDMPNKLNIQLMGVFSFLGIFIPFLTILFIVMNLIKCKFRTR